MNIPHLDQWLGDWAMEPDRMESGRLALLGLDLHVHLEQGPAAAAAEARQQAQPVTVGQVEMIYLNGALMKSVPSAASGTSTVIARRRLRAAAADPNISAILLHIDSPGGTVAGTDALAADVAAAKKRKPVYAYIDDLGASAAYWVASQATKVFANPTALVGSIGTYGVIHDTQAAAALKGVKVHVVRAGAMKGAGEPGTEISAALLAEAQARVDALNEHFLRGVASGRGLSLERVRELADGRIHLAAKAWDLKLIDGVQSLDETYSQLLAVVTRSSKKMDATQSQAVAATAVAIDAPPPAPVAPAAPPPAAATLSQLKAACPGANPAFLLAQLEAGATVSQAQTALLTEQSAEIAELKKAPPAATALAAAPKKPGVQGLMNDGTAPPAATSGDPIAAWDEAIEARVAKGKTKAQATRDLAIEQPEMRAAYAAAYTQVNGPKVNRGRSNH